jgi:hypothetical protein
MFPTDKSSMSLKKLLSLILSLFIAFSSIKVNCQQIFIFLIKTLRSLTKDYYISRLQSIP